MSITIPEAVREMLSIVERLCTAYPKKKFTLDGRLVGDIGEALVQSAYALELFEDLKRFHDAESSDGRLVQIKATMKGSLTFPAGHIPDYYIGVQIHLDGTFTEVFNGPGAIAWEAVKGRALPKTNLHSISISALRKLQSRVAVRDRIPLRAAVSGCRSSPEEPVGRVRRGRRPSTASGRAGQPSSAGRTGSHQLRVAGSHAAITMSAIRRL
jgi:hypothetical protein